MPYRNERYRRRKQKRTAIIGIVVAALLIEIVVVIVLLSRDCSGRRSTPDLTSQQTAPAATETPVPEDTSVPAETPMSVPTPSPAPAKQSHAVNGYLPIYEKVDTSEKVIAVTVDDLLQPTNLKKICQLAKDYNAKLTLFPIGKMLEREDIRSTVKRAYEELGFEIENHTYGHNRLYMEDEAGLANAVCKQQMLVNDTLGVNYQMHFLRMQGGNGEKDPRSHQYLDQLGYLGIASWSYSGSNADISAIKKHLRPGGIYLFHTTNTDLKRLQEFIPYAVSQGYRLVTLNELLGFEENETTPLTTNALEVPIPSPSPYVYDTYVVMGPKTKMYPVQLLQKRLIELKYLPADSAVDGDYGTGTLAAVKTFQQVANLKVDGYAGEQTQALLFSDAAPVNPNPVFSSAASPQATVSTREEDTSGEP